MKTVQEYFTQQQLSPYTIKEYTRSINEFMRWCEAENISAEMVQYNDLTAYIQHLQKRKVSVPSIMGRVNALKNLYKYMVREKIRSNNPALQLKIRKNVLKKVLLCLPENQLDELYMKFLNHRPYNREKDKKAHLLYCITLGFIIYQGLTSDALKKLLVTDINTTEGHVYIAASLSAKERILKLEAKQMMPIVQYIQQRKGEKFYYQRIQDLLFGLQKKIYLISNETWTIRDLLNSRIINWLNKYPIRQVQYRCGFKYLSSLKKYQQQQVDGLKELVGKYHPLE